MLVHCRVTPTLNSPVPIYTPGWREAPFVRVKCLAQEHNTMFPTRDRTRSARSRVERANHCRISYREGLGMSPSIMGLTTQEPYSQTEHTACPEIHTFLCKFWSFWMAVSCSILAQLTQNLRILWSSVCSFWIYGSCVVNTIIHGLVPRQPPYEIRQWGHRASHESYFGHVQSYL